MIVVENGVFITFAVFFLAFILFFLILYLLYEKRKKRNLTEKFRKFSQNYKISNKEIAKAEQIFKFKLIADEWSPVSGELSPTLKLKRKRKSLIIVFNESVSSSVRFR